MSAHELVAFLIPLSVALAVFCVGLWRTASKLRRERDAARQIQAAEKKILLAEAIDDLKETRDGA